MTLEELYREGCAALEAAGVPDAKIDAFQLLEAVCKVTRTDLYAHGDRELFDGQIEEYRGLLQQRGSRIPLQHLLGHVEFMGLDFVVNDHVLCPRQDTEILVEEALHNLYDGYRILDLCTGSGCILLSLLHYSNDCAGIGVDLSEDALAVARENAQKLGLDAKFIHGDLFDAVEGQFEMIVSNPPYIRSADIDTLMPEVRDHEPRMALDGDADGLIFYRRMIPQALNYLCGGGMLLMEIGADQGADVKELMEMNGYREVQIIKDLAGLDRVVLGAKGTL